MADTKRVLPAPISAEMKADVQKYAMAAFKALGCSGVSRVDFLVDKDTNEVFVNEINSVPGSLAYYLFGETLKDFSEMLEKIIDNALYLDAESKNFETNFNSGILSLKGVKAIKK